MYILSGRIIWLAFMAFVEYRFNFVQINNNNIFLVTRSRLPYGFDIFITGSRLKLFFAIIESRNLKL